MQTVIPATCRVLGVDTSLRATGVGVVEAAGSRLTALHHGTLRTSAGRPLSACLLTLQDGIAELLASFRPDVVAVEGVFFARNVRTTLLLGQARGAVLAQCARSGVPVYEYEPRRVKLAVVGFGGAAKEQVQHMVASILHLPALPPEDAADALAIAICHLHNRTRIQALAAAPI